MSEEFKKGFLVALGVLAAVYVVGLASGVLKRVV